MPPWWVCLRHPKSPNVQLSAKHDLGPLNGSTDSEQGSRWSDPPSRTPLLKVVKHFFGLGVAKGGLISGSFSLWLKPKKRCQFTLVSIFSLGGYCSKELFGTSFWRFEANCLRLINPPLCTPKHKKCSESRPTSTMLQQDDIWPNGWMAMASNFRHHYP